MNYSDFHKNRVRYNINRLINKAKSYNNIVQNIITTMIICTNLVRRRIKIVSISESGVPFI